MLNLRIYARGRPQSGQRLRTRTSNFSFLPINSNLTFLDKASSPYFLNGMPSSVNKARACSFEVAVVSIVTVIPLTLSILS